MRLPASERGDGKLGARIFAVLAALFLVGAVAMGSMLPDMTLYEALHVLDPERADAAQAGFIAHLGRNAWNGLAMPMLLRPAWLLPFFLGVVFAGGGLSFSFHAAPRPKRWHG